MPRTRFYRPEDPTYTIIDSLHDSVRFALRCLEPHEGNLRAISTFVNEKAEVMEWHNFGVLEGPGWAANAVGGAWMLYRYGQVMGQPKICKDAVKLLDYVLARGFIDAETGFITGYRHIPTDSLVLNYQSNNDWFCAGSTARIAFQLLLMDEALGPDNMRNLKEIALNFARWLDDNLEMAPNGWFPRRSRPDGSAYTLSPHGEEDPLFAGSADGLFILDLYAELTALGLADYGDFLREKVALYMEKGGIFGSINHDTFDEKECVAYACGFRTLRRISRLLEDKSILDFAHDVCLRGLRRFEMREDQNGVQTTGLLYMEDSWDTAYLWENAEAAQAYLEAYADTGRAGYLRKGLTILRAIAKHHHGRYGFLTEGVDWNNHVGEQHHFDDAEYGDIQYTEPLLNNLHIAEPTLYYLTEICLMDV
jgi:hypothetical protein